MVPHPRRLPHSISPRRGEGTDRASLGPSTHNSRNLSSVPEHSCGERPKTCRTFTKLQLFKTEINVTGAIASVRQTHPDLAAALKECRQAFLSVALFSGVVNILMLAGPLYLIQIYDRVLSSRNVPTLVALSVFLVIAYGFQGGLDVIRSRVVVRS